MGDRSSELINAAGYGLKETVLMLLAVPDINVNIQDQVGCCALILAALQDRKETVQLLLAVRYLRQ